MKKIAFCLLFAFSTISFSLHSQATMPEDEDNMCGCTVSSDPDLNDNGCQYNATRRKDECIIDGHGPACSGEYPCS